MTLGGRQLWGVLFVLLVSVLSTWLHQVSAAACGVFAAACGTPFPWSGVEARPPALGAQSQPLEHPGSPGTWAAAAATPDTNWMVLVKLASEPRCPHPQVGGESRRSHTAPDSHCPRPGGSRRPPLPPGALSPPREDPAWHRPQRPLNAEAGSREQGGTAQLLLSGTSPIETPSEPASLLGRAGDRIGQGTHRRVSRMKKTL